MRLFFAIEVPGEIKRSVVSAVAGSGLAAPPWRWIVPENFHITLKFLGETDQSILPRLKESASIVASSIGAFTISFTDFGGFPDLRRPRVLFYRVEGETDRLAALASSLDEAAVKLGFAGETREFRSHLTLARVKKRLDPAILDRLEGFPSLPAGPATPVESFSLIRSRLGRSGASYERLALFDLRG